MDFPRLDTNIRKKPLEVVLTVDPNVVPKVVLDVVLNFVLYVVLNFVLDISVKVVLDPVLNHGHAWNWSKIFTEGGGGVGGCCWWVFKPDKKQSWSTQ